MKRLLTAMLLLALAPGCAAIKAAAMKEMPAQVKRDVVDLAEAEANDPCKDPSKYDSTPAEEYYFGRSVAANLIADYGASKVVSPSDPLARYVSRIGQLVALAAYDGSTGGAAKGPKDRSWPHRGFHFIVISDPAPNAFGLPGGFVLVTTGLLALADTEDEIAAVLAHEVAHVRRGHGLEIVREAICRRENPNAGLAAKLNQKAEEKSAGAGVVGEVAAAAFKWGLNKGIEGYKKGHERATEYEADRVGARFTYATGYSAGALKDFLGALPDRGDGLWKSVASNHPSKADRIRELDAAKDPKIPEKSPGAAERAPRFEKDFRNRVPKAATTT